MLESFVGSRGLSVFYRASIALCILSFFIFAGLTGWFAYRQAKIETLIESNINSIGPDKDNYPLSAITEAAVIKPKILLELKDMCSNVKNKKELYFVLSVSVPVIIYALWILINWVLTGCFSFRLKVSST